MTAAAGGSPSADADLTGAPDQFDFMARLVRANALVPFVMFIIVTVALFFARLVEQIASVFGNACVGEEKVDEVPPFSDLIFPGDARYDEPVEEGEMNNKLSGLRSYRLEDNPTYMKLFPEVLSADGTSRAERPATPASKAPQAQNMV